MIHDQTDPPRVRGFAAAARPPPASASKPAFAQSYPTRPITVVVPWGAGGGTDATARIVARAAGEGSRPAVQRREPHRRLGRGRPFGDRDRARRTATRIGMITVEITHDALAGADRARPEELHAARADERRPARRPGRVGSSPYKTIKELADAIKAAPAGKIKASGTGQGGIWHLALVGWLTAMGLKADHVPWVPSNGAAPAMQDLAAGGIDIVTCSVPEAKRHDRRRQGARARRDGAAAQSRLRRRADAEGSRRHRLLGRRLARHRGAEGPAGRHRRPSSRPR